MDQGEIDVEEDGSGAGHRLNYRMMVSVTSMRDWKDTLNLPRTDFPMKANLPATEPATIARWDAMDLYARIRDAAPGRAALRAARRPALRQRPDPHRPRAQQDPEGLRRQVADDGRASTRRTCRAGTATACRSSSTSRASWARPAKDRSPVEFRRACRDVRRRSSSTRSATTSSASASSATGTIRI